jgi:hypothetical protein
MRSRLAAWAAPALLALAVGASRAPGAVPPAAAPLKMKTVTLHVFHRAFEQFHDRVEAQYRREFRVGDTDYTATVVEFVPDFTMDLKTRKVTSRTQEPNNPAWRLIVRKRGVPQDTTWAFLNMPPHFARKSLIAFLATRATFENHAPVASRDSLAIRLMRTEPR